MECQWDQIVTAKIINIKRPDLEHMKPLQPRDAYSGGRVNAAKLYYICQGFEKLHYVDVTSMFPFVMSDPQYVSLCHVWPTLLLLCERAHCTHQRSGYAYVNRESVWCYESVDQSTQ